MLDLLVLLAGLILLLIMILKFNINTFVSLIVVSVLIGIGLKIPISQIPISITNGIGSSLNELAIVFGFGAMLGRLITDAGGAYRISYTLINFFGEKYIQFAIMIASFIVGVALFFQVGMVLLIPIIFVVAIEAKIPLLYLGIPMAAALSITHGLLPPHPAPMTIARGFNVNPGTILIYGIIMAIPMTIIGGIFFTKFIQKLIPEAFVIKPKLSTFGEFKEWRFEETPSFLLSILTSLMPVILMIISTFYDIAIKRTHELSPTITIVDGITKTTYPTGWDGIAFFLGSSVGSMFISLLFAMWSMGWFQKRTNKEIAESMESSIKSIAMLFLIIGGGAALKQILIDGGISAQIEKLFNNSLISPLVLAWLITAILRFALGSGTVAALTAAGIVSGVVEKMSPEMSAFMVLAIGAGSIAASHVNDSGFWMFKECFDLDIKQTLKTWTVLETLISIVGLGMILLISNWL
ncbi:gluconate:H+ symporter [Enterococcus ureasiticus]|uniref:Gluconate permease n=1 Tax=Enterococcus ureasiticus TaxID=903984 RepID=A0A1E5GDM1_9ENTE|nr:gluconate:H+ symporter [Enterococcus ureasiticus]OEG10350.1 gluconate permease [Enterococcus ureasiticus]